MIILECFFAIDDLFSSYFSVFLIFKGLLVKEKRLFWCSILQCISEEIQVAVDREGSFSIEHMELFMINRFDDVAEGEDIWAKAKRACKIMRNFLEFSHHFGEKILDKLCDKFTNILVKNIKKESSMNIIHSCCA